MKKKESTLKVYFYLDKNKAKILITEYNFDDFDRNDDVFYKLIQNKVKEYDKIKIFISKRGQWIINDFVLDTIAAWHTLKKSVEAIVYDVSDPDKTDEDIFNDKNAKSKRIILWLLIFLHARA